MQPMASSTEKSQASRAKEVWSYLGDVRILDTPVLVFFILPSTGASLIFDRARLGQPLEVAVMLAIIGYVVPVAFLLAVRPWLQKMSDAKLARFSLFAILNIAGFLRGFTILSFGQFLGYIPASDWVYRLVGGPVFFGVTLFTIVALYLARLNYIRELTLLRKDESALRILQATIRGQVEAQRAQLVGRVQGLLAPAIWELNKYLTSISKGDASDEAVQRLRHTVEDVVRPLTSNLAVENAEPQLNSSITWRGVAHPIKLPDRVNVGSMFGLGLTVFTTATLGYMPAVVSYGADRGTLVALTLSIFVAIFLVLFRMVFSRLQAPIWVAAAIVIGSSYVTAVGAAMLNGNVVDFQAEDKFIGQFAVLVGVVSIASFANELVRLQRRLAISDFESVNAELSLLNSNLRQEVWLNQRRTASVLHGPIQAALYASAMKLANSAKLDTVMVESVQADIADAMDQLTVQSNFTDLTVRDYLVQIVELWQDACDIQLSLEAGAEEALAQSSVTAECTLETVREAISNAIKHGSAKQINVSIETLNSNLLKVTVDNDGTSAHDDFVVGYGSQLLNEITHSWSLKQVGQLTVFEAEVVVAK